MRSRQVADPLRPPALRPPAARKWILMGVASQSPPSKLTPSSITRYVSLELWGCRGRGFAPAPSTRCARPRFPASPPSPRTPLCVPQWYFWLLIGIIAAWLLVTTIFVWRGFRNYKRYKQALEEMRARERKAGAAAAERDMELAAAAKGWADPLIAE